MANTCAEFPQELRDLVTLTASAEAGLDVRFSHTVAPGTLLVPAVAQIGSDAQTLLVENSPEAVAFASMAQAAGGPLFLNIVLSLQ